MRFTADCKGLAGPLGLALEAAGKTARVRCEAGADALTLVGTDTEVAVTRRLPAEVATPGACLLPARFAEALRRYGGPVDVEAGDKEIRVRFTKTGATKPDELVYPAEGVDTFYSPPEAPPAALTLPAATLLVAVDRTLFAAAKDEGKYAMRGVLWDVGKKSSHLVATDGHRLAVADLELAGPPCSALFPPKAMELVRKLLGDSGEAGVTLRANDAFVTTDAGAVYTRLVEGRYPPYREVIPKDGTTVVTLDSGSFLDDVERAALATDDESKRVTFAFGPDVITMEARGASVGTSDVRHYPKAHTGRPVTINFDPKYMKDARAALAGEVTLTLTTGERAGVFRRDGFLFLVVPLV